MKKIFSILALSALLITSGCGSDDTTNQVGSDALQVYETEEFKISYPKGWEVIDPSNFSDKVAPNTLVGFRNNLKNDIFTANINVVALAGEEGKSTKEQAQKIINNTKNNIFNYKEVSRSEIQLNNKDGAQTTDFIVFEGKNSAEEDVTQYAQTFISSQNKLYVATGAYRPTEEEKTMQLIQASIKTLEIKQ